MVRDLAPIVVVLAGSVGYLACTGGEKDRLPPAEVNSGATGTTLVGGDSGGEPAGEGGETATGGTGPGGGGASTASGGTGTGGLEADTVLDAELYTTNGFTFRRDGEIFNAVAAEVAFAVVADARRGETVSATIEAGESVNLDGVLKSNQTWVLVESASSNWYSTWQQVDTADSTLDLLFAVTVSDIERAAGNNGVTLDPDLAQIVLRVEDFLGDGAMAEAVTAGQGAAIYSRQTDFDVQGPSDAYGYVLLLNVPATETAASVSVDVTVDDVSVTVPVRVQSGAVSMVVVTMPQ
jgi:hypothetical protein